ncbi:MAG: hypothetical protein ACOY82_20065 [Pseudomonadota bacterium]
MQGEVSKFVRRTVAALSLALCLSASVSARDPAMVDRSGQPRSERAQWVYRIVAKWGGHVQEAYRTDPRRWAASMEPAFARAPLPALRKAAEARSFTAMNDALLAAPSPTATLVSASAPGTKALGDPDKDLVYVPVTPCRILDTRIAGGPIAANSVRDFDLADATSFSIQGGDAGNCNVGDKGSFAAAVLNITVVQPSGPGYITAYPHLATRPVAATSNYVTNEIRNSLAIVRLDQSQATYEFTIYSYAQTHVVADVVGYFSSPSAIEPQCLEVPSTSKGISRTTIVDSPSCPVGYSLMGGDCKVTDFYQYGPVTLQSSHSSNGVHTCAWYGSGGSGMSIARCCRI